MNVKERLKNFSNRLNYSIGLGRSVLTNYPFFNYGPINLISAKDAIDFFSVGVAVGIFAGALMTTLRTEFDWLRVYGEILAVALTAPSIYYLVGRFFDRSARNALDSFKGQGRNRANFDWGGAQWSVLFDNDNKIIEIDRRR